MSLSEAIRFADKLTSDSKLLEAVKPRISGLASFVQVGNEHGFSFSLDDAKAMIRSKVPPHKLSDEQLDAIAGGGSNPASPNQPTIVTTVTGTVPPMFDVIATIVSVGVIATVVI